MLDLLAAMDVSEIINMVGVLVAFLTALQATTLGYAIHIASKFATLEANMTTAMKSLEDHSEEIDHIKEKLHAMDLRCTAHQRLVAGEQCG